MHRTIVPVLILIAAQISGLPPAHAQGARFGRLRIDMYATPQRVPADGHSASRVRIEVRDGSNSFVADGTQVVVHTDLGFVSTPGGDRRVTLDTRTQGGFASVEAMSDSIGTAAVSAQVLDSRNQVQVDFVPPGQVNEPDARVLDIKGHWVGYAAEAGIIEARDRAEISFGRLHIEVGDVAQIDTQALTLRAQSVVIQRDGKELRGEDLFFDIGAKKGVVRLFGKNGVERQSFSMYGLAPLTQEYTPPSDAFRMSQAKSDTWMVASSISYFIGEKICLRHAALFIQGQKVFSFPPLWIIAMPGYNGASNSQILGVSSSGGLAVDMPFFYRVTDAATGAIKVQKGSSSSSILARTGWSLALQEEYRTPRQCEGTFVVDGLPRSDWGVNWRDSRPIFGDSQGAFNIGMPDHRSLIADASIYRFGSSHRFNLRADAQRPVGYDASYGIDADWLTNPRRINRRVSYRVGTTLGVHRGPIYDVAQGSVANQTVLQQQVFSALDFTPWTLTNRTSLRPSFTNTFVWNTGNTHTNSARGQLTLDQMFGALAGLSITYAAEVPSGFVARTGLQQLVTFDFHADRGKWNTYCSASRDLTNGTMYSLAALDYFPKRDWRIGLTKTFYSFGASSFNDLETTLARKLGEREIGLTYSTESGRIWLQVGGAGGF